MDFDYRVSIIRIKKWCAKIFYVEKNSKISAFCTELIMRKFCKNEKIPRCEKCAIWTQIQSKNCVQTYLFYLKRIKLIISYFVFTNKQFWLINYNQVIFFLYCSVLHMYNTFHLHRFSCTAYTTIYIEH